MLGYSKTHHVWFARDGSWFPVGVGKNHPVDISGLDSAIEIAQVARGRQGVQAVMVVIKETARYSSLLDAHEYDTTNYLALTEERLGIAPF